MMMRSTPPRSENLAEMPVPAPAPMIGSRALTRACNRFSAASRPMNGMYSFRQQGQKLLCDRIRKRSVVDVQVQLDQPNVWPDVGPQRFEQCRVCNRIVERLFGCVQ